MDMETNRELMTVREFADYIRCGITKARKLLADGTIKSIKLEGSRLIRKSDVDEFLNSLEEEQEPRYILTEKGFKTLYGPGVDYA